jgi:hypothetical protein
MPVTLQPKERDALWAQINSNFTLFGDLELAMSRGEEETCYRLGRKISDGLRLILDGGLGWQEQSAMPTVLTLPDTELRGLMHRMQEQAVTHFEARRPDAEQAEEEMREIAGVREAADSVFDQTRP